MQKPRHCERSEAIQKPELTGLLRFARNDGAYRLDGVYHLNGAYHLNGVYHPNVTCHLDGGYHPNGGYLSPLI